MNLLDPGPVPPQTWAAALDTHARSRAASGYSSLLLGDHTVAKLFASDLTDEDKKNAMAAAAVWIAILGNVDCGMAT